MPLHAVWVLGIFGCGGPSPASEAAPGSQAPDPPRAESLPEPRDADGDGFPATEDCDDDDPAVSPGAHERCGNLVDDDCDGRDEENDRDTRGTWYPDADGDGWGSGGLYESAVSCADSPGWVRDLWGDCDDADASFHPYASEICGDGVDRDCDQQDCPTFDLHGAWAQILGADDTKVVVTLLGSSVTGLGDIDGDGADDLAASASGSGEGAPSSVFLFTGATGVHGPSDGLARILVDGGVTALASAGDVDADGAADVWLAPRHVPGEDAGVVLVSGALRGEIPLSEALVSRISLGAEQSSGAALFQAGDPDGDGLPDLLVSTFDASGAHIWWFDEPALDPLGRDDAKAVFEAGPERAGVIAASGDVDGDGLEDALVTVLPRLYWEDAWVALPEGSQGTVPLGADGFTLRETPDRQGVFAGLTAAVDLDRDGYADVMTAGENGVAVWLGPVGSDSTTEAADLWLDASDNQLGSLTVTPLGAHAVAIGDPNRNTTRERGAIYVLEEPATGVVTLATLDKKLMLLGTWAEVGGPVSPADVDGDGLPDLIIGVPWYPYPSTSGDDFHMGAVFLMRATDW